MSETGQKPTMRSEMGRASRHDEIDRVARAIIAKESAVRDAKMDRLRAARLAQEALEPAPQPPKTPAKRVVRRRSGT